MARYILPVCHNDMDDLAIKFKKSLKISQHPANETKESEHNVDKPVFSDLQQLSKNQSSDEENLESLKRQKDSDIESSESEYEDACSISSIYDSALSSIEAFDNIDKESDTSNNSATDDIEWPEQFMEYDDNPKLKPNWYYKNGILYTRKEPDLINIYRDPNDTFNEDCKGIVQFCRSPRPDETPYSQIDRMDKKAAKWYFLRLKAEDTWFGRYNREQLDQVTQLRLFGRIKMKHSKAQRRNHCKVLDSIIYPPPKKILEKGKDGRALKWIGPGGRNAKGVPKKAYIQADFVESDVQHHPYEYDENGYRIAYEGSAVADGFTTKARRLIFNNDEHFQKWQTNQNRLLAYRQAAIDANNSMQSKTSMPNQCLNLASSQKNEAANNTIYNQAPDTNRSRSTFSSKRTIQAPSFNMNQRRRDVPKPVLTIVGQPGELEYPEHTINFSKIARMSRYCIWGLPQMKLADFQPQSFASVSILTINTDLHFILIPKNYFYKRLQMEDYLTDILPSVASDLLVNVNPRHIRIGEIYIVYLTQGYDRFFRACIERQEPMPTNNNMNILLIDFGQSWYAETSQFYRFKETLNELHITPPTVIIAEVLDGNEPCELFNTAHFKELMEAHKNDQHEVVSDLRVMLGDRGAWCMPIRPSNDGFRLLCNLKLVNSCNQNLSHAIDVAHWLLKKDATQLPKKMNEPPDSLWCQPNEKDYFQQQQLIGGMPPATTLATTHISSDMQKQVVHEQQ